MSLEGWGNLAAFAEGATEGYQKQSELNLRRKQAEEEALQRKAMLDLEKQKIGVGLLEKGIKTNSDGVPIFTDHKLEEKEFERNKALSETLKNLGEAESKYGIRAKGNLANLYEKISDFESPDEKKAKLDALKEQQKENKEEKKRKESLESELRKEFLGLPTTKDMSQMDTSIKKITNAAKQPSAANDMAIVFNFMKLQDPGSTVREGEYATAENARGVDGKIIGTYNKLLSGERLSQAQRDMFLQSAQQTYNAGLEAYSQMSERYRGIAKKKGLIPEDIVLDYKKQESVSIDPKIEAAKKALQSDDPIQRKGAENFLRMKGELK